MKLTDSTLTCRNDRRREAVREAELFGLDYVEIASDNQLTLNVFFLGRAPEKLGTGNVALSGGRRIRDVRITSVRVHRQNDPTFDDYLEIRVNKAGDFSDYTIQMVEAIDNRPTNQPMAGFDPRYAQVSFSFKAGCPTDLDCKPQCSCPPPLRTQPEINYLAKDYESFRQLILDRLAVIMPDWQETHPPDFGIALVELLAYAGDYLSYYQDAVATEAYLGTARERISVRRHARLVDYLMHDGCNARAWLTIQTQGDSEDFDPNHSETLDPSKICFTTAYPGAPATHVLSSTDLERVPALSYEVFEPLYWGADKSISIFASHSKICFYTWGDCECCLAPGSTSATLLDAWDAAPPPPDPKPAPGVPAGPAAALPASTRVGARDQLNAATTTPPRSDTPAGKVRRLRDLKPGDVLIFEEVLGPKTANPSDADPSHRQAVRLTKVTPSIDPLYGDQPYGLPVVEIEWAPEDALKFPLCISAREPYPDCGCLEDVSVARGNVVLIDNGATRYEILGTVPTASVAPQCPKCCEPTSTEILPGPFPVSLSQQPLTLSVALPPPCSATAFLEAYPSEALPSISLSSIPPGPPCSNIDYSQPQLPCEIEPLFSFDDLTDAGPLANAIHNNPDSRLQFLLAQLSQDTRQKFVEWAASKKMPDGLLDDLISDLGSLIETWLPQRDLLESGPQDKVFVVENDNDGVSHLRFGDGVCGYKPEAGTLFRARYRVGNGTSGNVGADTITYLVFRGEKLSGSNLQPRNPMPASGGVDPEPIDDVKQFAPYAFRDQLERAITAEDYGALAGDNERRLETRASLEADDSKICRAAFTRVQRAKGDLRWTGSWYTALVALDPLGSETADRKLLKEVTLYLEPFRRMGHDLLVRSANYVPLKLSIRVCVLANYLRGHVEAAVKDALSNRMLPDGTLGFFHPDNLTFGDGIYVSRLLSTVQSIPGVQNAMVTELERYEISEADPKVDQPGEELPINSALLLGPFEIAQLDNDPNYPENGVLLLDVRGGR